MTLTVNLPEKLAARLAAEAARRRMTAGFLRLITSGELQVDDLTLADYKRCVTVIESYHDLALGLVDASIVAVAEKHNAVTVATLNVRDFRVVRPRHAEAFEVLP